MADTCVARVPVFAGLSAPDQGQVARVARPTRVPAGATPYASDAAPAQLMVVHVGRLKVSRLSADGAEQIVRVLGPGEFTGEAAVFTGDRPDHRVVALEEATLCVFRHDDLQGLIRTHPEIGLRMLATVSARLSDAEDRLNALTSRDVEARVAAYLLRLPAAWHDGVATVTLPLAKKDVASLLDTTPESLSRALTGLAGRGIIALGERRAVTITRPDALQGLLDEG